MLGWILVGLVAIFLLLLYITPVRISIYYGRIGDHDHLVVEVSAWFRLIRWKRELPVLRLGISRAGPELEAKVENGSKPSKTKESIHDITGRQVKKLTASYQDLLERVTDLEPILRQMMKHIRCTRFEWHTSLGLGEAAATGTLTGIAYGIKSVIIAAFSHFLSLRAVPAISVQPDWNNLLVRTRLRCILHFRLGHAMIAGVRILFRLRKGREQKWQTTPSRA
ncbi:DUF2953 domain-containing protein [Brevibacillus sp. H7]|uniref:DUF2953 domain-containing protein n=1 Tax=Brevibacillus sp. H7 TaxID=3349138 RepID=UPI00381343CF